MPTNKKKAKKDTSYAPYDDYKQGFVGYNKFNNCLANKTWPYFVKSDAHVASNYLLLSIVLNAYHLFIDVDYKNPCRINCSYYLFCSELAREIMVKQKHNVV